MDDYYEIVIEGDLDPRWSEWFAGMKLINEKEGYTMFSGRLPDQSALHGLLERIRDLNLTLVSVNLGSSTAEQKERGKE